MIILNKIKLNTKGFTLIELIIVISIISILAAITVPNFIGYIEKSKEEVCNVNCLKLERMYELYLETEGLDHSDVLFKSFLNDYSKNTCPSHGEITYINGEVRCSVHIDEESIESDDEDDNGLEDGSVPFL